MTTKTLASTLLILLLGGCSSLDPGDLLEKTATAKHRSEQNINRDIYRNPKETLEFFGIEPDMTVVEIWPGSGWYTEVLAPVLTAEGQLYAAHFPENSEVKYYQRSLTKFKEKLKSNKVYSKLQLSEFYPGTHHQVAPEGSADMLLTFRNLHNWYMQGDNLAVEQAFKAFFKALKPGGILGIVDHRLPEHRDTEQAKKSGYVKQSWVIELAQQAGFQLVAKSEVNANPKDTADHVKGVWTLPPRLALGEQDNQKYQAIGESDRMTIKFVKPALK